MSGLSWSAPEKRLGRACRMWPSGALAYPLDLRAEEIRIEEIAEFFEPEIGERRKSTRIKPLEWSYAERAFLAAWRRYGAS